MKLNINQISVLGAFLIWIATTITLTASDTPSLMLSLQTALKATQGAEVSTNKAAADVDSIEVDISKLPPAASKKVDFVGDIKPLFEKSCFGCHGANQRAKSKFLMNTRKAMMKGGKSKVPLITIGKSAESPLVALAADFVSELKMPPLDKRDKFSQLNKQQIALIRAWIDQGAKWPDGVELKMHK